MAGDWLKRGGQAVRGVVRRGGFDVVRHPPRRTAWSLEAVVPSILSRLDVQTVVDVGARNGEFGTWLRSTGYAGQIVSFEPIGMHFEQLSARARADGSWIAHNHALGSAEAELDIHVAASSDFSSFRTASDLCDEAFPEGARVERTERVRVARLDEVWDTALSGVGTDRVYLKMDTQGWDLEVLAGAQGVLEAVWALQTELSMRALYSGMPDHLEVLGTLAELGYVTAGLFPVSWVEDVDGADPTRLLECDGVFTRR